MSSTNPCNVKMEIGGLFFTDFRPNDKLNEPLGIHMNSHQYRHHLQKNASGLMRNARMRFDPTKCTESYGIYPQPQPLHKNEFV